MGTQQRTDGQGQQAGDEGALAPHPVAEPAEHHRSDGHADQAAVQDPDEIGARDTPVGHDGWGDERHRLQVVAVDQHDEDRQDRDGQWPAEVARRVDDLYDIDGGPSRIHTALFWSQALIASV